MTHRVPLDRRAFLKGIGGMALALPVLDAMGAEVTDQIPRRFCAIYTANGMSLPRAEHGIDEWSWFPRAERDGEFVFGKSTEPLGPFREQLSFLGGLYHPNGPKADPHVCSDMWLTGAPLHNPKPGTYNSVGLDQVVALHTKQYCRQPSLVLSIDAGTGFLSRTGTISYSLEGRPIPAENNPRRVFDRLFRGDRESLQSEREQLKRRIKLVDAVVGKREGAPPAARQVRSRADGPVPDLAQRSGIAADRLRALDRHPAEEAGLLASESRRDQRGRARGVLPQHVRPDRAGLRRRYHAVGHLHAQPRRRHGHQRHVPAQARACRRPITTSRTRTDKEGQLEFAKYDLFLSQQVAHFLGRLSEYQDRNGSVLDNTIVLFGSGASTTHNPRNLPTLIAGGANMGLKHGTYWRSGETRMSNLYLSILRALGIEQESFADSTATLNASIFGRA